MFQRNFSTGRLSFGKKDFFKQNFYVHHPLLDQIIEAKLEKCLKYGQIRDCGHFTKPTHLRVIEAPCIVGNSKKIEIKRGTSKQSFQTRNGMRPKTTNTVIRSRTSEPRIRHKLEYLMREQENIEESLKPTFVSKRFLESRQ